MPPLPPRDAVLIQPYFTAGVVRLIPWVAIKGARTVLAPSAGITRPAFRSTYVCTFCLPFLIFLLPPTSLLTSPNLTLSHLHRHTFVSFPFLSSFLLVLLARVAIQRHLPPATNSTTTKITTLLHHLRRRPFIHAHPSFSPVLYPTSQSASRGSS